MNWLLVVCGALAWVLPVQAAQQADQLIVAVRHGEKPAAGLGQLTCQGLQRAPHV